MEVFWLYKIFELHLCKSFTGQDCLRANQQHLAREKFGMHTNCLKDTHNLGSFVTKATYVVKNAHAMDY